MHELDRSLFLHLNGLHSPAMDGFWIFVTGNWAWAFLFVPIAFFIFKKFGRKGFVPALCVPLLFLLADQGSNLIKNLVARPRPCRAEDLQGLVHFTASHCGQYGFWSAHAANVFAQITFFILLGIIPLGRQRKIWYPYFILFGLLVSISRIMVGVHYPGDIVAGMLYGIICGLFVYAIYKSVEKKWDGIITR